jgi:hypothetical protein
MRQRGKSSRSAYLLIAAIGLTSCSAAEFSEPIATFANATATAETALNNLNKAATDDYTAFLKQRALTDPRIAVNPMNGECELGSMRCRLALIDPALPREAQPFPPDPLLDNMVALMRDVRLYAQGLSALAADDSAAKAEQHVNAALGSIQNLANTVAKIEGNPAGTVPSFATPVGAAVNWLVGQYAEQVKLHGLRKATAEADPIIQRTAALLGSAALFGSDPPRVRLLRGFREKMDAFQPGARNEAKLSAAVDSAKTYDAFLRSQSGETFQKMGEAHSALTQALNNTRFSWSEVIARAQAFAAEAERLAKVVQGLAGLAEKK